MYIESKIFEQVSPKISPKVWVQNGDSVVVEATDVKPVFDDTIIATPAEVRTPSSSCMICASYDKMLGCVSQFKCPYLAR
ncbi:MAG: hypothetical protein E7009_02905 [Alphaproteobacteria bacterium]|nr:hypothetical protein [Alphaproteobacteria bacterium]